MPVDAYMAASPGRSAPQDSNKSTPEQEENLWGHHRPCSCNMPIFFFTFCKVLFTYDVSQTGSYVANDKVEFDQITWITSGHLDHDHKPMR